MGFVDELVKEFPFILEEKELLALLLDVEVDMSSGRTLADLDEDFDMILRLRHGRDLSAEIMAAAYSVEHLLRVSEALNE